MAIEDSVKASLRYLAGQLSKDEKTIEEATDRIMEIIDKNFNKKYEECFNEEVNKIEKKLREDYPRIRDNAIQHEKDNLERSKEIYQEKLKILYERENEINKIRRDLLQSDPRFFTATVACKIAGQAAGIDIDTDIFRDMEIEVESSHNNFGTGEITYSYNKKTNEKKRTYDSATEYTKQQLIRTVGVIWAAAFGMKQIGGKIAEDESKIETK